MPLLLILLALFGFTFAVWGTSSKPSAGVVTAETIPAAEVPVVTGIYPRYAERRLRAVGLVPVLRWCSARAIEYVVGKSLQPRGRVYREARAYGYLSYPRTIRGSNHRRAIVS